MEHLFRNVANDVDTMGRVLEGCEILLFDVFISRSTAFTHKPVCNLPQSCRFLSQNSNKIRELEVDDPKIVSQLYSSRVIQARSVFSIVE